MFIIFSNVAQRKQMGIPSSQGHLRAIYLPCLEQRIPQIVETAKVFQIPTRTSSKGSGPVLVGLAPPEYHACIVDFALKPCLCERMYACTHAGSQ